MSGDVVLTFLLQMVKDVYIEHKNLKDNAQHELQLLSDELSELQSLLNEAATMPEKSDLFKEKERKMRQLVYEIEDAIEICSTKTAAAKAKNLFSRICGNMSTQMEKEVKGLREKKVGPIIKDMYEKFGMPKINHHGSSSSIGIPDTKTHQPVEQPSSEPQANMQNKIVDFQDEATIIGYLMDSKEELDVIAITGIAGLGKTTFASKIFQHKDIIAKFPLRIWTHVSVKFDAKHAFRRILRKITLKDVNTTTENDLIVSVRESLRKKEFLLVMDDVWTKEDWAKITKILPMENGKGKVLVTTRDKGIASNANIYRKAYELKDLAPKESLELLILQVFSKVDDCHQELKRIGHKIVERYGGVPLTILVVGGILRNIFSFAREIGDVKDEWLKVLQNVNEYILMKDDRKLISNALELSYKRLDHDLRACFLYTGLFPEKHEIPVSTLKQLWIAEGFIQRQGALSLEESAEENLDKLINMNLVMVAKKNHKQVKACRVHDMIREFCRTKADDEDLFRVIQKPIGEPAEVPIRRRLCFDSDPSRFLSGHDLEDAARLRSFLCFYKESVDQGRTSIPTFPVDLKSIRVLNCRSIKFQQFPEVKKLILLKHITLFIENLDSLPEEISHLVNLQTLIIDTSSGSIKVKANIWKMIKLMRLKTKVAISLDGKNWRGKSCGKIQTISRLSPESCKPALSKRAPNLKALGVRGKLANLVQTMRLGAFQNLEKLKLVNDLDDKSELASNPMVIDKVDCFPPKLKSLTLSRTYLNWHEHMHLLANIKTLEVLKLKDNAFTGVDWLANDDARSVVFEELRFLLIEDSGLVIWEASNTLFPNLRSLVIKNCQQLREIPEMLTSLQSLEIERVNQSAVESAKRIALKRTKQYRESICWEITFKLTIGPGCDQALSVEQSMQISSEPDISSSACFIYITASRSFPTGWELNF